MRREKIFVILFICMILLFINIVLHIKTNKDYASCNFKTTKDVIGFEKGEYTGLYDVDKKYFCVWTQNRSEEEILRTTYHEACHYLVAKDYDHYCTNNSIVVR